MKKRLLALGLAVLTSITMVDGMAFAEEPAAPAIDRQNARYNDSGAQLNRTRRYLEEQAIRRRIEEGRQAQKVETDDSVTDEQSAAIRFVLNKVTTTESMVLTAAELEKASSDYIGKEVTLNDLYKIVANINQLYFDKGFVTCRAFLSPQTIHEGEVQISLVEGKTAEVNITGNKHTKQKYIMQRAYLEKGKIQNINELNKNLLRFNATNDAQLRIALKAGQEVGTTDYEIQVWEPQNTSVGVYIDNGGSKSSGEYREGIYFLDRSLTGRRDSLYIGAQRSQGTKSVSASYATPVNHRGTKVGTSFSSNSVEITDGALEPLNVHGHSYAWSLYLSNPMVTTEKVKSEWGLELTKQHSVTDFSNGASHWVNDDLTSAQLYVDQINYGRSTVFYQKHAYKFGQYDNNMNGQERSYGKYTFNTLYQKIFQNGQNIVAKIDGQIGTANYLPSAEMYYIGGLYSVRGYKESLLGGDSGYTWSAEYSLPLDAKRRTSAYVFLDGGSVFGDSAFDDHTLVSTGFGIRTNIGKRITSGIGLGIPLIKTINGEEQNSGRLLLNINGQF